MCSDMQHLLVYPNKYNYVWDYNIKDVYLLSNSINKKQIHDIIYEYMSLSSDISYLIVTDSNIYMLRFDYDKYEDGLPYDDTVFQFPFIFAEVHIQFSDNDIEHAYILILHTTNLIFAISMTDFRKDTVIETFTKSDNKPSYIYLKEPMIKMTHCSFLEWNYPIYGALTIDTLEKHHEMRGGYKIPGYEVISCISPLLDDLIYGTGSFVKGCLIKMFKVKDNPLIIATIINPESNEVALDFLLPLLAYNEPFEGERLLNEHYIIDFTIDLNNNTTFPYSNITWIDDAAPDVTLDTTRTIIDINEGIGSYIQVPIE